MKILLGESCRRRLTPTEEGSGMAGCRVDGNSRSERKKKSMFVAGHEFLRFSYSCPVFERRRKRSSGQRGGERNPKEVVPYQGKR